MKDTWYKRLGWFLLFSLITLAIFFVIDLIVHRVIYHINDNEYSASFIDEEYVYEISKDNEITLRIATDAKKYYFDIWIDDYNLNIKVENKDTYLLKLSDYDIELAPGEHIIKSSFFGGNTLSKYRESLITTKLIVK